MPRKITHGNVQLRDLQVVGYVDLRPIDWASGKRIPLEAGAGHICDRCGAEHAIVWTLEDVTTHEAFKVGSTCAKRTWGFNPDESPRGRALVKEARKRSEMELYELLLARIEPIVRPAALEILALAVPEPEIVKDYKWAFAGSHDTWFSFGDVMFSLAEWQLGNRGSKREAVKTAMITWYGNRAEERIPLDWKKISVTNPDKPRYSQRMFDLARSKILNAIRGRVPPDFDPWRM
jgi:hypothetical protein